ncbi:GNAT family N-acetyltransferase, partial [Cronobacter muytjensii]|uniref:GNAT family N-acetyltransferase n=1 Tax=Cronobacter muytjensii TaxID=413501 RepID=UPI0034D3A101
MMTLKEVTKENWIDVISLAVRDDQKAFIASNAVSLAQLLFLDEFVAKAIYADDELVGFALYGVDEDDGEYWIYRFMIDQKFQGKNYGREAMTAVIEDIRVNKEPRHKTITLSYDPK